MASTDSGKRRLLGNIERERSDSPKSRMTIAKNLLQHCQVETPRDVVALMWAMARKRRSAIRKVLDLGAGDARFADHRKSARYVGYEIDAAKVPQRAERGRKLINSDVLEIADSDFDLAIGNPPYIRKALIDSKWRDKVISVLEQESGISPRADSNAFVYFVWLALLRTARLGLVIQLVPVEWISRPSAAPLRKFIRENGWAVSVFRLADDVFDRVLTTAAIVVIDKSKQGPWEYSEIRRDGTAVALAQDVAKEEVLGYEPRKGDAYALRGLSPGGQEIYLLSEEQRLLHGLKVDRDVVRCVSTLRHLQSEQLSLTESLFQRSFVDEGVPCWLIRSDRPKLSSPLVDYLESVEKKANVYTTNTIRKGDWFSYRIHPAPDVLVASGFREKGPKTFSNEARAIALGSVYGVFVSAKSKAAAYVRHLRDFDFRSRVLPHSNGFLKIEVRQLNAVLSRLPIT